MKLDWLHRRVREIVDEATAEDPDRDVERLLVGDAVVTRVGDHYRIERGGDSWEELERLAVELRTCPACHELVGGTSEAPSCARCGGPRGAGPH